MTFLDEQGVGPCGHAARDKGILIKVFTSCLSRQVPRQLAFSVRGFRNDTGDLIIDRLQAIADSQLTYFIDATAVRCGQHYIQDKCLRLPQENWKTWNRIHTIMDKDKVGKKVWSIILTKEDESIAYIKSQLSLPGITVNVAEHGKVLKSGWGDGPTVEERASVIQLYLDGSLS